MSRLLVRYLAGMLTVRAGLASPAAGKKSTGDGKVLTGTGIFANGSYEPYFNGEYSLLVRARGRRSVLTKTSSM